MTKNIFDLSGKVALITGGNAGIGLGFARALATAGADVCIWGRREKQNAAAVADLQSVNPAVKIQALVCDVANEDQVTGCFPG